MAVEVIIMFCLHNAEAEDKMRNILVLERTKTIVAKLCLVLMGSHIKIPNVTDVSSWNTIETNVHTYYTRIGAVSIHVGILYAQGKFSNTPLSWILRNTYSTCDIKKNSVLVTDICMCAPKHRLTAYTNGGEKVYNLIADLKLLLIQVYFKKSSMAIISSLKWVGDVPGARLHLDTTDSKDITLTLKDGRVITFQ